MGRVEKNSLEAASRSKDGTDPVSRPRSTKTRRRQGFSEGLCGTLMRNPAKLVCLL